MLCYSCITCLRKQVGFEAKKPFSFLDVGLDMGNSAPFHPFLLLLYSKLETSCYFLLLLKLGSRRCIEPGKQPAVWSGGQWICRIWYFPGGFFKESPYDGQFYTILAL